MRRSRIVAALALALCLAAAGCGLKPASAFIPAVEPGSIKRNPALEGVTLSVTSKDFTEQLILGKIAVLALTAAGATVQDKTNVQGSVNARRSVERGDADLMFDYTGTGWITYLGEEKAIADPAEQYEAVRDLDLRTNRIAWLPPSTLDNVYALAVTQANQRKYGLKTLSDLRKVPLPQRTFCMEGEFMSRDDGMPGMMKAYGYTQADVPKANIRQMATGVIYNATASGSCVFGEVFTTDGRIPALNLFVLEDDKSFFPNYNVSMTVRQPVLQEHPELKPIFEAISKRLNTKVMQKLNAKVDVDGEEPVFVAKDWLIQEGFIS